LLLPDLKSGITIVVISSGTIPNSKDWLNTWPNGVVILVAYSSSSEEIPSKASVRFVFKLRFVSSIVS